MISKETLTPEWIEKVSKANRNADKILVEKVIRALLLLEGLSKSGLPFIFKGGTALMLLTNSAKRLSIDIDIIISENRKDLDEVFEAFAKQQGFTKVEMQHRTTASSIEKAHYKFFYIPVHKTNAGEEAVLLDILFEANNYKNISLHEIKSDFLITTANLAQVNIPSFEDLLGDKLTAFAPNTTGIPYFKKEDSMSMEIIKQLYDIGNIFDVAKDLEVIKITFSKIVKAEMIYRELKNAKSADGKKMGRMIEKSITNYSKEFKKEKTIGGPIMVLIIKQNGTYFWLNNPKKTKNYDTEMDIYNAYKNNQLNIHFMSPTLKSNFDINPNFGR
jgi:predicted nucleotidyltransferase component of viral defense system